MQTVTGALAGSRRGCCCGLGISKILTSLAFGTLNGAGTVVVPVEARFLPAKHDARLNLLLLLAIVRLAGQERNRFEASRASVKALNLNLHRRDFS